MEDMNERINKIVDKVIEEAMKNNEYEEDKVNDYLIEHMYELHDDVLERVMRILSEKKCDVEKKRENEMSLMW